MRARAVMVPTASIAKALKDRFDRDAVVVYEGINRELSLAQPIPIEHIGSEPFLLYVGNCYPHKNIDRLLVAARGFRLVMVGPRNSFSERYEKQYPEAIWCYNVENGRLKWLYLHAHALVNPSLAEGFGLPVVEALAFGCPVVCSDIPVFHEVTEEQATFFDPYSIDDIRTKLVTSIRTTRKTRAPHMALSNTFEQMAAKTINVYQLALVS